MSARPLGRFVPQSPDWHAVRAQGIGGSDIAAVMGWSPFGTRADLLAEKLGQSEPRPETAAMRAGNLLEPAVLAFLADKHQLTIDLDASATTWQHPALSWALYNPDGSADGPSPSGRVLLEAKTTGDRTTEKGWGRAGTAQIPLGYLAQITWGMGILGLPRCHVGVLAGGVNGRPSLDFASYTVPFRPDLYARLLQGAAIFHQQLTATRKAAA